MFVAVRTATAGWESLMEPTGDYAGESDSAENQIDAPGGDSGT